MFSGPSAESNVGSVALAKKDEVKTVQIVVISYSYLQNHITGPMPIARIEFRRIEFRLDFEFPERKFQS